MAIPQLGHDTQIKLFPTIPHKIISKWFVLLRDIISKKCKITYENAGFTNLREFGCRVRAPPLPPFFTRRASLWLDFRVQFREPKVSKNAPSDKWCDEMLETKRTAKLSEVHLRVLESRLGSFGEAFQINIAGVSGAMLQAGVGRNGSRRSNQAKLSSRYWSSVPIRHWPPISAERRH